ncbi:MAG: hypothetical protein IT427_02845 [Pirellulales bacterium]|nr:hypothetical protein [Pirellulales bacterium]
MKVILPIFTVGILLAGTLPGQTAGSPAEQGRGAPQRQGRISIEASLPQPVAVHDSIGEASRLRQLTGPQAPQHDQASIAHATLGAPTPLSQSPPQGADLLVKKAADALAKHLAISARVRFHVDTFGYQSIGQGTYLQHGVGDARKIRWELKTSIGEQIHLWQQVCDGRYLWQLTQFAPDEPTLNRVDLRRVRQAMDQAGKTVGQPLGFQAGLASGGLPQVAEDLRKSFRFMQVEEGRLDQLPVWIATGTWQVEVLRPIAKELANQAAKGKSLDLRLLPEQLPEEVLVYLGQDDLFPYRINYRRRGGGQGRGGQGRGNELQSIVLVELYEVQFNPPIDERQFEYEPAAGFAETTEAFLKSLGVKQ